MFLPPRSACFLRLGSAAVAICGRSSTPADADDLTRFWRRALREIAGWNAADWSAAIAAMMIEWENFMVSIFKILWR